MRTKGEHGRSRAAIEAAATVIAGRLDGVRAVGALIGWGIPEERVKQYDPGIREGGILMAVRPRNDEDASYLENSWKSNRGENVYR